MAADTSRWQPEGERPSSPVTASPSFLAGTRGVRVGTVTAVGRPVWGPTAAPRAAVPVDTIARPRGFAAVLTMILHL
jgi:hypothetical protein